MSLESFVEDGELFHCPNKVGSSFHHWGAKTERSCYLTERVLFALSNGGTSRPADVVEQSAGLNGCSSVDGLDGKHHYLELDAGCNRKPMEVTEEGGHLGVFS